MAIGRFWRRAAAPRPLAIVVYADGPLPHLSRTLDRLADTTPGLSVEIPLVIIDPRGRESARRRHRLSQIAVASGAEVHLAAVAPRADIVVHLQSGILTLPGWLTPLVEALAEPDVAAAAPVVVAPDGTIAAAGWGDHGPGLAGLPVEDADTVTGQSMRGLADACVAARPAVSGGRLVVVPTSRVRRRHGTESASGWRDPQAGGPSLPAGMGRDAEGHLVRDRPRISQAPPRLRWAIKNPAPTGLRGERWGDTHFARRLAIALRALGQEVVIDHAPAFYRETGSLDDVTLTLRGLRAYVPRPEQINLLWIISHPELLTAAECAPFDAVYAASTTFAADHSDWGIRALLQCTDPARFHPDRAEPDTGAQVLFVGNNRGAGRPIVAQALEAGLPLEVHGNRWDGVIATEIARPPVPNDRLGQAYRAAGMVLGDHAPDMAAQGFISNRIFDAVAAGARAVSDPVQGLAEVLPSVRVVASAGDLRALWAADRESAFGTDASLRQAAAAVAAEHSFDRRAARLLDDAAALWRAVQR